LLFNKQEKNVRHREAEAIYNKILYLLKLLSRIIYLDKKLNPHVYYYCSHMPTI